MRDGNITVFVMWKRLESRVTVSEDITELFIFSYLTTSWKMLWYDLFESTRVLFYLNLTIDEKKRVRLQEVFISRKYFVCGYFYLIEGFVSQWDGHILDSGRRVTVWKILNGHLSVEKGQEKLET